MREVITIGIMGVGGVKTIGDSLLEISQRLGYFAFAQMHNTSQVRDGPVAFKITIDSRGPRQCCEDQTDIFLCFSWQRMFAGDFPVRADTLVLFEEPFPDTAAARLSGNLRQVDFSRLSREKTGSEQPKNMICLGMIANFLGWPKEFLRRIIEEEFAKLSPKIAKGNLKCLEAGFEMALQSGNNFTLAEPPANRASETVIVDGNKAVAVGADYADCKFLAFYPITPSTGIAETIMRTIIARGGLFVQAEDEISALSFCLGASEAGVKALDVTSGPGLDLKTETIGLAVIDEIPVVIVDVQRAGPATGLATMTEQSDLWHAVKGGHGDAPRVVLAPYNIGECHRLIIEAFNISEALQVPVILLSDQLLGQSRAILDKGFLTQEHPIVDRLKPPAEELTNYKRYAPNKGFVSPMVNIGDEGPVYQTAGSTHNEKGEPTADTVIHDVMHMKRRLKLERLRERTDLVMISGPPSAEIGIIAWGSTGRVVLQTIKNLGLEKRIKVCVPELISPLPVQALRDFFAGVKRALFVEMNDSGQFYRYLRTEIDLPQDRRFYFRPGGLPFLQQEIANLLKGALGE